MNGRPFDPGDQRTTRELPPPQQFGLPDLIQLALAVSQIKDPNPALASGIKHLHTVIGTMLAGFQSPNQGTH